MPLPPKSTRTLRSRIGGLATAAKHDPAQYTEAARQAFLLRFLDEVDPRRELLESERYRRAAAARKAYFARLALKSAQARSSKRRDREEFEAAELGAAEGQPEEAQE